MSNNKRRKETQVVTDDSSDNKKRSRRIWGKTRKIVLEAGKIPEIYHSKAVVKKDGDGLYHIYYGGLNDYGHRFHGHAIVKNDGTLLYQRLPFDKHSWGHYFEKRTTKKRS